MSRLLQLFLSFLQVGALAFGGGYAAIPLIKEQVTQLHPWLTLSEFTDLVTIAEMTPGPIAINAATFVGMHLNGIVGAVVATLGAILPACLVVSILGYFYNKYKNLAWVDGVLSGFRPAIVAMIAAAGFSIFRLAMFDTKAYTLQNLDVISLVCFIGALFALRKWRPSPIKVMLTTGVLGAAAGLLMEMAR
ncbi:MAG: chromate transporter [Eubacteriales bacterium]|nr:chromate transporter [Eubacteriales bacterium]MDD4104640.1 chromate transporter [Eubacteriales bacterium]MDD4710794.1 chromate transporter [Eubacteriales bacterium]NLO14419.1 chromate transporter [Clostridiales bacterium]